MSLLKGRIHCDICGRFIALKDLIDRTAYHKFAGFSVAHPREIYDSFCKKCLTENINDPF